MRIRVRGATAVDPERQVCENRDVLIENGRFIAADRSGSADEQVIDAAGLHVMPGLIDAHAHLRDPGFEYREDIASGTASAARGGFTAIAAMPNTQPVCDNAAIVRYILEKASAHGAVRVLPVGAVSKGSRGLELAEIGLMAEAGIVAVSDDGRPVETADLMQKAMRYASAFGLTVIDHCEDLSLAAGGQMNEGRVSTELGLSGIPTVAESIIVARDCLLAEYLGLPVHLAHISGASSLRIIRDARARGVAVTAETCPHYFTLTDEACRGFDTRAKMNPPLQTAADVEAVIDALADGTLSVISTDHAPHHADEKDLEFGLANNGIIGFETAFSLGYEALVLSRKLSLAEYIGKMTTAPAALLRQPLGTLRDGAPADLILADLSASYIYRADESPGKSRNTPFDGRTLKGRVLTTICGGRIVHDLR